MKQKIFILSIFLLGLGGIIAQVILLRELLVVFYGNELCVGIILANWLILEAIGSFFGGRYIETSKRKIESFVVVQIIFSLFFPLAVYFSRTFKSIWGFIPFEGLGVFSVFVVSGAILSVVAITHGALFSFGCKIFSQVSREEKAASVGRVYVYEVLGTLAGGILLTYLLIPYFSSFQIVFVIASLNLIVGISLLVFLSKIRFNKRLFICISCF